MSVPLSPLEHASIALAVAQERANGHQATVVSWIRDHALEPLKGEPPRGTLTLIDTNGIETSLAPGETATVRSWPGGKFQNVKRKPLKAAP